jgi:hypothetical protein
MRIKRGIITLILLLTLVSVVSAQVIQQAVCTIPAGTTIEGNLYALCRELKIEGKVEGHVFAAAFTTDVTGEIGQGLYLLGASADIRGRVGGDLHYAGVAFRIHPGADLMDSNYTALALSTVLEDGAVLGRSAVSVGYQMIVDGAVGGGLDFWGSALRIEGRVDGAVTATVGNAENVGAAAQIGTLLVFMPQNVLLYDPGLVLGEDALIVGRLRYWAYAPVDTAGRVLGMTEFTQLASVPDLQDLANEGTRLSALGDYFDRVLREFITLALLGILLLPLAPALVQAILLQMRRRPVTIAGVGVLTFTLSFPVFLLMIVMSVLVIVLLSFVRINGLLLTSGLLFGLLNVGGASLFYFVAIYVSRTIVAIGIGRWLVFRVTRRTVGGVWLISLLVGSLAVSLLVSLPVIGFLFNGLMLFFGLGAIIAALQGAGRSLRGTSPVAPPPLEPQPVGAGAPHLAPPPMLEPTSQRPRGMDNLPDGFVWWGDESPDNRSK